MMVGNNVVNPKSNKKSKTTKWLLVFFLDQPFGNHLELRI